MAAKIPTENLAAYLPYCATERQREILEALISTGSQRQAAPILGISRRNVQFAWERIKRSALRQGFDPETGLQHGVTPGQGWAGTSTLLDFREKPEGEKLLQWVKTRPEERYLRTALQEAAAVFFEDYPTLPAAKPKAKRHYDQDIIPWFQIGDAHIGMLAHEWETGQNFDLKIAERELCAAMTILIEECEPRERCVINDLGDFSHYENFAGTTDLSGHALDYDGRFTKMIRVYSRLMRAIIDKALTRFRHVDVIVNQGNHSRTNDIWVVELLRVAYQGTGRVHVLDNSSVFIPYRMGNTFVMTHHSDKCKPGKLANVMATDFHQDWGEARHRYIDIGHIHHQMVVKEHPGVVIESWNQLAAPDKYAHDGGWRSRQCLTRVDRSRTYGEVGRRMLGIAEVRDSIIKAWGAQEGMPADRRKVYSV
jgi:hypothetical protein